MSRGVDILVFGAHPDDAEIGMGGTLVKHTNAGFKVVVCDLTQAEMSSNGTVHSRQLEAEQAANILGIVERNNLQLPDRGLDGSPEQIEAMTRVIRKYRPRIVFAPYWQDRHPDHVRCSDLVQEAVFNAKLRNYMPSIEPVNVDQLFFYFINDVYEAQFMVDVSAVYEQKKAALRAYSSQFLPAEAQDNDYVSTPLTQGYLERVEARDHLLGQKANVQYAEGFVSKLPYRVDLF